MNIKSTVCAAMLLLASPVWAINKCTGLDGKVVFQNTPCAGRGEAIDVRPASGHAPAAPMESSVTPAGQPAAGTPATGRKKEGAFGESWRRKTDLESYLISDAKAALNAHLRDCDTHQRVLASKKNLLGITWLERPGSSQFPLRCRPLR